MTHGWYDYDLNNMRVNQVRMVNGLPLELINARFSTSFRFNGSHSDNATEISEIPNDSLNVGDRGWR